MYWSCFFNPLNWTKISVSTACITRPYCLQSKDFRITKEPNMEDWILVQKPVSAVKRKNVMFVFKRETSRNPWTDNWKSKSSLFLEMHNFSMTGQQKKDCESKVVHLFPVNSVRSRGLGLTLPLHLVSEHDNLRLGRGNGHRVNVWQRENGKRPTEKRRTTHESPTFYISHLQSKLFSSFKQPCDKVVLKTGTEYLTCFRLKTNALTL